MYQTIAHEEYVKLSARTLGDKFYISNGISIASKDGWLDGLHASIGLVTEVQEILLAYLKTNTDERIVNIGEEIADAFFYISIFERVFKFSLADTEASLAVNTQMTTINEMIIDSIEILDLYKKQQFYGKEVDINKLYSRLVHIVEGLELLAFSFGHDTCVLKAKNINKLKVRYPNSFSEDNAINRNLEKEYTTLV